MGLKCEIRLSDEKKIYRGGQSVTGIVNYTLDKPTEFKSITVSLKGDSKIEWQDSSSDSTSSYQYTDEEYVSLHKNILQGKEKRMQAGLYTEPFEFMLPEDLPSSYDDTCRISYRIIAHFTIAGLHKNIKEAVAEIKVIGYVKPCAPKTLVYELSKKPFSLKSKETVVLEVKIEKTFIKPGDDVKLGCTIKNDTNVPIIGIKTKLVSEDIYMAGKRQRVAKRKAINASVRETPCIRANSISKVMCIVPTLPNLYSIQNSRIFKKDFKVKVTVMFPFPHKDVFMEIPVVIGEKYAASKVEITLSDPEFCQFSETVKYVQTNV